MDELGVLDAGVHEHGGGGIDASEVHAAAAVLGRCQVKRICVEDAADLLDGVSVQLVDLEA